MAEAFAPRSSTAETGIESRPERRIELSPKGQDILGLPCEASNPPFEGATGETEPVGPNGERIAFISECVSQLLGGTGEPCANCKLQEVCQKVANGELKVGDEMQILCNRDYPHDVYIEVVN